MSPISAAVRATPRRQPAAQMKIWCASGTSMPVWTMFQVPRQGGEYSSLCGNGAGKLASPIVTQIARPGAGAGLGKIRLSIAVTSIS